MAKVYFKVYLDVFVEVPDSFDEDERCDFANDKLEQALKQMVRAAKLQPIYNRKQSGE